METNKYYVVEEDVSDEGYQRYIGIFSTQR